MLTLFRLPFAAAVVLGLGAAVAGYWWLVLAAVLLAALVYAMGRDPVRDAPSHPLGIVSPIDAQVVAVGRGHDPFLNREALTVRMRQRMWMTAVLCSPTEGRVEQIWGGPDMPGFEEGVRLAIHVRTDEGDDVIFAVGRPRGPYGPLAWSVQPGERVGQGQRRGLVGWGREAVVYVPARSSPTVQSGTRVEAGTDLVCRLVHVN
ncbi:MAG: hypothetical protein WD382_07030 [Halofilum sp. (in: g-proteobacteria)]